MTSHPMLLRFPAKYLTKSTIGFHFILDLWSLLLVQIHQLRNTSTIECDEVPLKVEETNLSYAETVLNRYGDAILRLAYSYLHNMADSEDILQETLLQMFRKAPVFESTAHEKAWLFRVTINLCKNKIKYNQLRRWEQLSESLPCKVPEDLSFVWEAVRVLPVKYREVIHLFYQENMPTAQIASLLNKQESTVRSLLHRGRMLLKEQLREAYDFEE